MRRLFRLLSAVLAAAVLLAASAAADFKDISAHSAADTLRAALDDGIIIGYGGAALPDGPITKAEAVTMICRALSARDQADISWIEDISQTDWYYAQAAMAVDLGIVTPDRNCLNMGSYVMRAQAYTMLTKAFLLLGAVTDTACLSRFRDSAELTGESRTAAAALVMKGVTVGTGGLLRAFDTLSRAEFLSMLYGIIGRPSGSQASGGTKKSVILSGDASLSGGSYGDIIFDCETTGADLEGVKADSVIIRCKVPETFTMSSCDIGRLAVSGGNLRLQSYSSLNIGKVVVGPGNGPVSITGNIKIIEVTCDDREVSFAGKAEKILLSGSNNTLRINSGSGADLVSVLYTGRGNRLILDGTAGDLAIEGAATSAQGIGFVNSVSDCSSGSVISVRNGSVKTRSPAFGGANIELRSPLSLKPGEPMSAEASVAAPSPVGLCSAAWYIDGAFISGGEMDLKGKKVSELKDSFDFSRSPSRPAKLEFVLSFIDESGEYREISAEKYVAMESHSPEYCKKLERDRVITLVTSKYSGDFTTQWALEHDYSPSDKEAWVNARGYSSRTGYLVWVSLTYQRVNVFTGSKGKWRLSNTFVGATGSPGRDTPRGVFSVLGKSAAGWTTADYTVKPVVNFYRYSYAFHSMPYDPGTKDVNDPAIGYPSSHGCVRMYTEGIEWIYDVIPVKTAVVVH